MPEKQKIFIPFTIDTRFWNKDMPNVFLNKVYEAQIGLKEQDIQYTTLKTFYTYAKDERFQDFCSRLVDALGEVLNQYHGLNESKRFWRMMLWLWVQEYAASIKFKIEQFNNLLKEYPPERYIYCSYEKKLEYPCHFFSRNNTRYVIDDEEYHFATYSWMAEKFFDFRMENKDVQKENKSIQNDKIESKKDISSVYERLHDAFVRFVKSVIFILGDVFPSQARVGLYHADYGGLCNLLKWFLRSRGAIQEISIPTERNDCKIDDLFRKSLSKLLRDQINASEGEQIVLDFLPYVLPPFFIEKFGQQYEAASDYLQQHKNLVLIHTLTSMLDTSVEKICMVLLKKRGGKISGQQHGGTYQVTTCEQERMRELEWNDIFYYWGKGALAYRIDKFPACKISYGPSYKFSYGIKAFIKKSLKRIDASNCFLFVGTAVEAYPRAYAFGYVDGEQEEYIQRQCRFFSTLRLETRSKMIVREYPVEYGWHMQEKIKTKFPELGGAISEQFNVVLSKCSLCIIDHLATTWLEAIYYKKPIIVLLSEHELTSQHYQYRKEEIKYLKMLKKVGVILHSPEKAAELVNQLAEHGVMDWWMDEERQRVMKIVRDRWTTKVEDIDDWWYHELMTQAGKVEREMSASAH